MPTENQTRRYLHILKELKEKDAKTFTQQELSEFLEVSVRKISDFQAGKVIDFFLLCDYAELLGLEIRYEIF